MIETINHRDFLKLSGATLLTGALSGSKWGEFSNYVSGNAVHTTPQDNTNILLIVLDTVQSNSMSLYGYPSPTTPNLQQLSKKGVLFERAISTAPWTLPAHVSMFTGYYPGELNTP